MRRYHILTLACIFLTAILVFSPAVSLGQNRKITPKIVGGEDAEPDAWTFIAALVSAGEDPFLDHFCGGSLIGSKWVATAAHCVFEDDGTALGPAAIDVLLGIHDLLYDTSFVRFKVQRIVPHPAYNPHTDDYDIALLELASETASYPTIPRMTGDATLEGELAIVLGWGKTSATAIEYPNILQQVTLPIVTNAECDLAYVNDQITENMLCAGFSEGGKDSCQGDSGGPLIVQDCEVWKLAGIVSWGIGCAEPEQYGVYSRVSRFAGFIEEYVGAQQETSGDVNQDGVTDITDVLILIDFISGEKIPSDQEREAANVDKSNSDINAADLSGIIDRVFGN